MLISVSKISQYHNQSPEFGYKGFNTDLICGCGFSSTIELGKQDIWRKRYPYDSFQHGVVSGIQ